MTILELVPFFSNTASIFSGFDTIRKHFSNSTAEDLFKQCFVDAVKQSAQNFAGLTDPEKVEVDHSTLDKVIASLKDVDIATLTSLEGGEIRAKITTLFRYCIILPGHQLTAKDLEQRLRPVLEKTIAYFYHRLPRNQEASNQTLLESGRAQLEGQERLSERTQAIKNDTDEIKDMLREAKAQPNVNISDAVATAIAREHRAEIDNARDLLNNHKPETALDLLEKLKRRIWIDASPIVKFHILTNMGAAQLNLNKEREAAMLMLEAFQYNPEDEKALSNRAVAHFLLGETNEAANYVEKTLEKNPANTNAYAILVKISTDEETLEEVIAKVPESLRKTPQIAYAISDIAKQRGNLEEARKWRETMVAHEQEAVPASIAALATILIEQVLADRLAVLTNQITESQKEELRRAIELLTEAWTCVVNTELHAVRTDWIINRSMAYCLLGESKLAIKDLDAALEIEPSHPVLLKNRAILALEQGEKESAIEFLKKIHSAPEASEAQILIATILFKEKRFDEAITRLNDFLTENPSSELQEEANYLLVHIYITDKRFEEAEQISTAIRESSPRNILNLVEAARLSSATGKRDEALSQLKEAYDYAQNSEEFREIVELADQLYNHEQFKEAATLYEKIADTSQKSELTEWLLKSYYRSGEAGKTLEICQELRAKYGPLENISKMEYDIYEEIGDMNQALAVCEAYLSTFPDDTDMQIRLASVYYHLNRFEELDRLLERPFDLKNLPLQSCFNLAYFHQIRSKPKRALDIMYEVRRTHYKNADAHLEYIGLFYQVYGQLGESLRPTQVLPGTAVRLDKPGETIWYVVEEREDADIERQERDVKDPLAQQLLGKVVNAELCLRQTPLGPEIGKIAEIKSKYVYACQESFRKFPELFPEESGVWSINLGDSDETTDSSKFQPIFDLTDKQHEASLRIEEAYKKKPLRIGTFANLTNRNVLDTWVLLMSKPDMGVRCSEGNLEERKQTLALLGDSQPKLAVDLISLMTIHGIGAADTVIKAFGKLHIAQSTINELQKTISEGMWSQREGMTIGKQGDQYVRHMINPEDVRRGIEHLKGLIEWIRENCEVEPCTAALQMNQLRKRELDERLQPFFMDTLLIASRPGYLLLSDDERLRSYAKTNLNHAAGTNFQIDGVWTQVVLEHCVNRHLLNKVEYDQMTIELVCFNYYHTAFDADVLIEAAKQSDWNLSEPYNSLVQALGGRKAGLSFALNVAVDFLCKLWAQPVLHPRSEYLTQALLEGLTSGRRTREVLVRLVEQMRERFTLYLPVEERIRKQIRAYEQKHPF